MARYGTFPYTTGILYGPTGASLFRIGNFVAKSREYGNISLSWDSPTGQWNRLRLVRSAYGYPAYHSDGTVLFDSNSGPTAYGTREPAIGNYDDDGHADGLRLTPGKTYYYTLFVQYSQGSEFRWARGADAQAIAVTDHDYLDFLLRRLPSIFTTREMQSDGQPSEQSSTMSRFMSIFAFDLARYRDTLESLRDVNDPDATNGVLLPGMGAQLAYRYEPEIGMRQNRVLMRNATFLAQRKGTLLGVSGLVSSVTGYGVLISPLQNLLHNDDDANAKTSIGHWVATGGALTRTIVTPPTESTLTQVPGVLTFTATDTSGSLALYDDDPRGLGIAVTPGVSYTLSLYVQSDTTTRSPNLAITWYDEAGAMISPSGTGFTTTNAWARASVTGTAPANASFATIKVSFSTLAVDEVHYVKAVQFAAGSSAVNFRPAREVRINMVAPRVNEVTNPSFDFDTSGWATSGVAASSTHDTTVAHDGGLASMKITTSGAGSLTASTSIACDPDRPFAASGYVRATGVVAETALVAVDFYSDEAETTAAGTLTALATPLPDNADWLRVTLLGRTPVDAVAATVRFVVADATSATVVWLDDVLWEHNDLIEDYFDKRTEPEGAWLENGATAYPARTHFYPLYPFRYARAKKLVEDSVLLGTTVTFEHALPR